MHSRPKNNQLNTSLLRCISTDYIFTIDLPKIVTLEQSVFHVFTLII